MICNVIIANALFKKTENSDKLDLFKTFKATHSVIDKISCKKLQRNIYRHIIAYADDIFNCYVFQTQNQHHYYVHLHSNVAAR